MKWLFFTLIIVYSCGGNTSANLSPDQEGLYSLCNHFRSDYRKASDTVARQKLKGVYEMKLQYYLTSTCDSSLKTIKVKLTNLEEDPSGSIHAEFRDENCSYVFHQVYDSSTQMRADIVYRFVKSLQRNSEMNLRFLYAGNVKIIDPEKSAGINFEIDIIPTAIG